MVKQKHIVTDCDMHFGAKLRYDLPVPAAVFGVERGRYHSHVSPLAQTAPAVFAVAYKLYVCGRTQGSGHMFHSVAAFKKTSCGQARSGARHR